MKNVGGSAGDGGFQFQAKIIAFVAVHILAQTALTGRNIEGVPVAVAAETNGPGDDIRIELILPEAVVELQAKKGLRGDARFDKTIHKIAAGLVNTAAPNVVLAVNRQTGANIKEKLSADLDRLRQGREDAPHDQKLLNRVLHIFAQYAQNQEHARSLAKRLSVCLFDVGDTFSYDTHYAHTLLRYHILSNEKQAEAAWNLLVQAGHTLIENRGRYEATDLVRLLQNQHIQLVESLLPVVKSRYQIWIVGNTATFRIPGPHLGLALPIDSAWTKLHVMRKQNKGPSENPAEQLRRYHEWESIASRADEDRYNAQDVAEIGHRVVIVGGPGAGKSTLCRKLAHDLTDLGELVMWVHLPSVSTRIQNGMSITAALVETATDSFNAPLGVREALFAQADCLLANGLDECGVFTVTIAQALQSWGVEHPTTRMLITTRPIGYESSFFSDWHLYELLPLTKDQVERSAQQIIAALAHNPTTINVDVERFLQELEGNHIASIAARNPLLLVFLLQLFLEDISLTQQRASLYEQILDVWRVSLPQENRNWLVPSFDGTLAWPSLELLGWSLLFPEENERTHSQKQLLQKVSLRVAHEMNVPLPTVTPFAQFWYERGVLDRLQIGLVEVYTFVHATFNEYAAGRYLASLSTPEIQRWVRDHSGDARWRETLLLAAGSGAVKVIVETLLAMDATDDQATPSLLLAAAALAEAPSPPYTLTVIVAECLVARLVSPEPSTAYTAAEQGGSLARRLPDIFTPLLLPLFQHPQQWTRLTALYLTLMSDKMSIGIEQLDAYFDDLSTTHPSFRRGGGAFAPGWIMHNKVIARGAEVLARLRPDTMTKERLQRIYEGHMTSHGTQGKLRRILLSLGSQAFIEEQEKGKSKQLFAWLTLGKQADQKMLETILQLASFSFPPGKKRRKLVALAVLLSALHISEAAIGDWDVLGRLDDIEAIKGVLLGYITGLQLDIEEVAQDADWALTELRKTHQQGNIGRSLLSLLPKFPSEREVYVTEFSDVLVQDLIRALGHPSAIIVRGAVQLLAGGAGREALTSLLFTSNDEQVLSFLAEIATRLWGTEARPLFAKRIEQGYTSESIWLIEELPHLPGNQDDPQLQRILLQALHADSPCVAIAAVHALQELDIFLLKQMSLELQKAHLFWIERGEEGKSTSYSTAEKCPTCRTDPGNARTHISHLLQQL